MIDERTALTRRECQAAQRLARLFRVERSGRLERRPTAITRQLTDRRETLIEELLCLEARRRSLQPRTPPELDLAMRTLAKEVECSEQRCLERLAELGAELQARRGAAVLTGLRDGSVGQLLGRG
jgi:hypothetical protein